MIRALGLLAVSAALAVAGEAKWSVKTIPPTTTTTFDAPQIMTPRTYWRLVKDHKMVAEVTPDGDGFFILSGPDEQFLSLWDDLSAAKAEAVKLFGGSLTSIVNGKTAIAGPRTAVPIVNIPDLNYCIGYDKDGKCIPPKVSR